MITVHNNNVNESQLSEIPIYKPQKAGQFWQGIQHGELVNTLKTQIEKKQLKILEEKYSVSNCGSELVGAYGLSSPFFDLGEEQELALGFITSNAMKNRLKIFVGSKIFVCSNGMVSGEVVMKKKHTIRLKLVEEISLAIDTYVEKIKEIPIITNKLKSIELSQPNSDLILMEAGRKNILPWSRIGQVESEYRNPTYNDFNEKTGWGLLNAFTHIVKKSPPLKQIEQINDFRELLVNNN